MQDYTEGKSQKGRKQQFQSFPDYLEAEKESGSETVPILFPSRNSLPNLANPLLCKLAAMQQHYFRVQKLFFSLSSGQLWCCTLYPKTPNLQWDSHRRTYSLTRGVRLKTSFSFFSTYAYKAVKRELPFDYADGESVSKSMWKLLVIRF